ncbi:MAG: hypothetical protein JNL60_10560 [Bacteroidia bacterium]|nr:hypothetical protein [Bacteroidia bacterium]
MQLIQEIVFNYAKVQLFEGGLIRIEMTSSEKIGLKESKEMNRAVGVLSKGKEALILMLADELASFDKEAMEFSASDEGLKYSIAEAMVVKSITQRLTANLYLRIVKPKKPSKIFNSEKEALKWLYALQSNIVPV